MSFAFCIVCSFPLIFPQVHPIFYSDLFTVKNNEHVACYLCNEGSHYQINIFCINITIIVNINKAVNETNAVQYIYSLEDSLPMIIFLFVNWGQKSVAMTSGQRAHGLQSNWSKFVSHGTIQGNSVIHFCFEVADAWSGAVYIICFLTMHKQASFMIWWGIHLIFLYHNPYFQSLN